MTVLLEQNSVLNRICAQDGVLDKKDVESFFQNPNWIEDLEMQLALQEQIILSRDIDAAVTVLSYCELHSNLALDFDVLMGLVILHASAEQALVALREVYQARAVELQKIVLRKGSHEQILRLKQWQASPIKTIKKD